LKYGSLRGKKLPTIEAQTHIHSVYGSMNMQHTFVSLSKKLYSNCLVLVGSRNGFERDLHKHKIACFTIELK